MALTTSSGKDGQRPMKKPADRGPVNLGELETRIAMLVCSFCRERRVVMRCKPESCPLWPYLPGSPRCTATDQRITKLLAIIDNLPTQKLRIGSLAKRVNLSASRLEHLFREEIGTTLKQFILERKLREAGRLLVTTQLRVSEIGYYLGFESPASFSRAFKSHYRLSPRQFRLNRRQGS